MTEKTPSTPKNPDQQGSSPKEPVKTSDSSVSDKAAGPTNVSPSPTTKPSDTAASKGPKESSNKDKGKTDATPKVASGAGKGWGSNTPPPTASAPASKKSSAVPLLLVSAIAVVLAGGLWYQYNTSQETLDRVDSQVRSAQQQAQIAAQQAQQALSALDQQRRQVEVLIAELNASQTELDGLNRAFQSITDRGSDLVLLNDIDHLVMIAQQQLQLNGNVANAIISLETAQAQLARANRPALAALHQTINGDLDRLRATSTVDIALLSSRLDELAGLVSQAPLLVPDDTVSELASEHDAGKQSDSQPANIADDASDNVWWQKALDRSQQWAVHTFTSIRQDLGQFISVRRVDDAAALLISPDQAARFRDDLRRRLMTAQLALMMDQSLIWETETDELLKAIESRFDPQSSLTRQAIRIARDVADTSIDTPLPDVSNSIKALEAINEQMGRRSMPEPVQVPQTEAANGSNAQDTPDSAGVEAGPEHEPKPKSESEPVVEPDVTEQQEQSEQLEQPESAAESEPGITSSDNADTESQNDGDQSDSISDERTDATSAWYYPKVEAIKQSRA